MNKVIFQEIPIKEICPNPHNSRKGFAGPKFQELVESIKQKGIIEPIIVRPIKGKKTPYEIVAGERRFKAAQEINLEKVPAIIRELTDDETFDFMIVENLQREDLTEMEEAESFRAYLGKHGKEGLPELAERTGIQPQYIRRRVAVLELPFKVVDAWAKGKILYGHLEQLLRVKEKEARDQLVNHVLRKDPWGDALTVKGLREKIDEMAPKLKQAFFDTAIACISCSNNSRVQKALFAIEGANDVCLDPKCFKQKQNDWLLANWKSSKYHAAYKTNGFRFQDRVRGGVGYREFQDWSSAVQPAKECFSCDKFVTILHPDGREATKKACLDGQCYSQLEAGQRATSRGERAKDVKKGGPRVAWHGEYFENVFFRKRVPQILEAHAPEDPQVKTLLLMCLAHANGEAKIAVEKILGIRSSNYRENKKTFEKFLALPYEKIAEIFKPAILAVFLEGQNVGDWSGFGSANRRTAAEFLGVDLAKEWAADEEYLAKKTKIECISFIKKFNFHKDPLFKAYIEKKFKRTVEKLDSLKKSEIIDSILKCGINLIGKTPDEILRVKS